MSFPFYKQHDQMDCGPSCLRMISKYFGKSYSHSLLNERSYITRKGVSLMGISEAAESIGFHTQGVKLTWEQLCNEAPLPCIVLWKGGHFVVVYKIKKRPSFFYKKDKAERYTVYVADPAYGLLKYDERTFKKHWLNRESQTKSEHSGIVLLFETTPDFYSEKDDYKSEFNFSYILRYLNPFKKFVFQILLATLVGTLLSMIFPLLTQSIVDYGIGNSDLGFIFMILIAQMIITLGQTANDLVRRWLMLHVTTRLSISLISGFLIKLMRLPISFFDTKMFGDIMQRIGDHERIQVFLTGSLINIIFSIFTLIMYSIIMATYDIGILSVFLIGSALYITWILLFLKKRKEIDYKRFQESSQNQGNLVHLVEGMQEIKLNNCEKQKRWEWERIQARLFKVRVKNLTLNQNQQIGSTLIDQLKNIFISYLSAKAVITGNMTLGMMMAVQYIIGQLNAPIQQFIGFSQSAQDAKLSLERLAEIHNKKEEEKPSENKIKSIPEGLGLEIRNLVFQYGGPYSKKVLNDISFRISPNKVTAIVGMSGSGKTTLMKLLLGFYPLVKGRIELNGIALDQYSPKVWRSKCGVVMQEGYIFSDTIANNITVSEEFINEEKLEKAINTANIGDFIKSLPHGLNTRIGSNGQGISSGQKQRILIARAVYKDPEFIFFDEATNALDSKNEMVIMKNLKDFFKGRTVVVIAHRLSTVKNADQIIVLEKGKVIEKGSHQELVNSGKDYYQLVKNQLELSN